MKLSPQELESALWLRFEAYLKDKLEALRSQNDGDMSMEATARLRGRIAQIRYLLALRESSEPAQLEAD